MDRPGRAGRPYDAPVRIAFRAEPDDLAFRLFACAAALAGATLAAAVLQAWLGIADASAIYLLAVVAIAGRFGTWPGVASSLVAFLIYDFLFTAPRFTFNVTNPQEWLSLLLFLVVAVVIGRLAALQAERALEADRRAREAQAMFGISRALATAESIDAATPEILERLIDQTAMDRIWVGFGPAPESEVLIADSSPAGDGPAEVQDVTPWVLVRMPGDEPAEWIRAHEGPTGGQPGQDSLGDPPITLFRVLIEADGEVLGSLWSRRDGEPGLPGRGATRSLSLAADQLGLALRREHLAEVATTAEVARRSDALKSALLDSVSHDLRTPLATIRALAGGLLDEGVPLSTEEVRESATTIDEEALRLSDIVRGLLDLSRIEAGELRPDLALHELDELVDTVLRRYRAAQGEHQIVIEIPEDLPVLVDALFFDQALTNVYDNALAHSARDSVVRLRAQRLEQGTSSANGSRAPVELVVEDSGPGLDPAVLEQVFDKFYRGQGVEIGSRHGLGIGLTIARGLTEAMGAQIEAGAGQLGGLAITFRLAASE
jgi:two-component system, OmpR family, sensor histidine kinase KdpD